jgi:hypothetical protein
MGNSGLKIGSVHLIESLPQGDLRTGERLFEDLEPRARAMQPALECHFWRESTRDGILNRLAAIVADVRATGRAPIVHIETHGITDETGLIVSSGEFVPWSALKAPLTTINVTCRLNLLVVLAACNGRALLEIVQITDRAPVWGLIGPNRIVTAGEIEDAHRAFYRTFFETRDGGVAWRAMNATIQSPSPTFSLFGAEAIFRYVMAGYLAAQCTGEVLAERKARIAATLIEQGFTPDRLRVAEPVLWAYLEDHQARFDEVKRHLFFADLCTDHDRRFTVSLDECFDRDGQSAG